MTIHLLIVLVVGVLIPAGNARAQSAYQPDLSMSLEQFEKTALTEKEEVWVVDFWASWCGPCIQSVPHMKEVHSHYATQGVRFVSISWDKNEAKWRGAMDFLEMPWQQLIVPKGRETFLEEHFPHRGIPTVFVIRRDGKIKKVNDVYEVEKTIEKALK